MLTLNHLLTTGGIDPAHVRLLRHRDPKRQGALFAAAMEALPTFDRYQEIQSTPSTVTQFRAAKWLASFIVEPISSATLFVGVWSIKGERKPGHTDDGFGSKAQPNWVTFNTTRVAAFDDYRGRLAIAWGGGTRAWVQRADLKDKPITEVRRVRQDIAFPGFGNISISLDQAASLPPTWLEPLRHARGIYLLVHQASGQQYVGSAYGADGFLGRWQSYADGHGGNVGMKELGSPASGFRAAILEVTASTATDEDIFGRENAWKEKLGTRAKGLNRN